MKKTSLLTRLVCIPWQMAAWYYMKLLSLWRGYEIFKISFEFKWKPPATKISSDFFFPKFVDKILQNRLIYIISKLLLHIYF